LPEKNCKNQQQVNIDYFSSSMSHKERTNFSLAESSQIKNGNQGISNYLNSLLQEAIETRTSDIHLETGLEVGRIRFRIDGVMKIKYSYPINMIKSLISRIKILSDLDITITNKLQEGAILASQFDQDIRVSIIPTIHGENAVLRILSGKNKFVKFENLGFSEINYKLANRLFSVNQGLILLCGPTGSGKTTTLFAALDNLNSNSVNIITLEDPVELRIPGINQIQVNTAAGEKFTPYLRAILRHDPDIIMVGELRDEETASMAVRAAMTGHLVLSTLHTTSAVGAVIRLLEMGLPAFLIADTVRGVIAQRLVRCLCQLCKGKGCDSCNETGFFKRTALQEVLLLDTEIAKMIQRKESKECLEKKALERGMISLLRDGEIKVAKGLTTPAEIRRVI